MVQEINASEQLAHIEVSNTTYLPILSRCIAHFTKPV